MKTETITEYREVTDDADFGSFGQIQAQKELAKGKILADLAAKDGRQRSPRAAEKSSSG